MRIKRLQIDSFRPFCLFFTVILILSVYLQDIAFLCNRDLDETPTHHDQPNATWTLETNTLHDFRRPMKYFLFFYQISRMNSLPSSKKIIWLPQDQSVPLYFATCKRNSSQIKTSKIISIISTTVGYQLIWSPLSLSSNEFLAFKRKTSLVSTGRVLPPDHHTLWKETWKSWPFGLKTNQKRAHGQVSDGYQLERGQWRRQKGHPHNETQRRIPPPPHHWKQPNK